MLVMFLPTPMLAKKQIPNRYNADSASLLRRPMLLQTLLSVCYLGSNESIWRQVSLHALKGL